MWVIGIMPFFQGIYFYWQTYLLGVLLAALLWHQLKNQACVYYNKKTLALWLTITIAYFLNLLIAVDPKMALLKALELPVWGLLLLGGTLLNNYQEREPRILIYGAACMSGLSLIMMWLPGFDAFVMHQNRLGGFFQYPNTFGIYLLVALGLSMGSLKAKSFQGIVIIVLLTGTVLTMSRSVLGLLVVTLVGVLILEPRARNMRVYSALGLGGLVSMGVLMGKGMLPVAHRLSEGVMASEFMTRLLYYQDALAILKDHPFGLGHYGYYWVQSVYQTGTAYKVKYAHSILFELLLDIGVIPVLVASVLVVLILLDKHRIALHRFLFVMLLLHSLMDFNAQFGAIILMGILLTRGTGGTLLNYSLNLRRIRWVLPIVMVIYLYMGAVTLLSHVGAHNWALKLYPDLTISHLEQVRNSQINHEERVVHAKKLSRKQPYATEAFAYLREVAYNSKDYKQAHAYALVCVEQAPMNMRHLERFSVITYAAAKNAYVSGDLLASAEYVSELESLPLRLADLKTTKMTTFRVQHRVTFEMTKILADVYVKGIALKKLLDEAEIRGVYD